MVETGSETSGKFPVGMASEEERENRFVQGRRLDDLVRGAPITSLAAIFAALALAIVLIDKANALVTSIWLATIIVANTARLFLPQMIDDGASEAVRSRRLTRGFELCGHVSSIGFGAGLPLLLLGATALQAAIAFLIVGGLLGANLLNAKSAPGVARGFVLCVTIGGSAASWLVGGKLALPMIVVLLGQAGILLRAVKAQELQFLTEARMEFGRRAGEAASRLLLHDYEVHSSDWLWTADATGRLKSVSDRFACAAGRAAAELEDIPLPDLFLKSPERTRLVEAIEQQESFRDLVVPLEIGGKPRAWSLSARLHEDGRISGFARDVTEASRAQERVAQMAHFDAITGLANRNLLNRTMRRLVKENGPEVSLALFAIDLDHFKSVNDTQGHGAGDYLLRAVGERLAGMARPNELVARLGGDEFAILVSGDEGDRALVGRAGDLLTALRDPFHAAGQEFRITASIGIARCSGEECTGQELLRRGDLALYAAKARGRDGYALFEPALDEAAHTRRAIELDLRAALDRGQLEVHYQPIIELDSGRITGHEALMRWQHPERGEILPAQFIPIAEESGLIVSLGEWIIGEALCEVASWGGDTTIAINISPVQMRSPNLVATIQRALAASGISPDRLELEITEGALMRNSEANRAVLLKLREMGVRIALDDFGTGYSSLGYLRSFPFDRIKIDRCFVTDLVEQADSQAIVAAVTRLAAALGMRTTAEGVERIEQLDMLRKLGCSEAQGFVIARPVRAGDLEQEEAQLALPTPLPAEIIDYRKARKAAQQKAKQQRARKSAEEARRA